ncbi:hypothetical protein ACET3Z_001078 [Daucus carota]
MDMVTARGTNHDRRAKLIGPTKRACTSLALKVVLASLRKKRVQEGRLALTTRSIPIILASASLLKRLTDIGYNDAAVDNRVLKADIETITAKPAPMSHLPAQDQRAQNGLLLVPPVNNSQKHSASGIVEGNKMERTFSMQRVPSLEHLQKGICGGVSSSETLASDEDNNADEKQAEDEDEQGEQDSNAKQQVGDAADEN